MIENLAGTVSDVVAALDGQGIVYAITGSVASGIYGEPHTTIDVDIVLRLTAGQAVAISDALSSRYYCSREMLLEAVRSSGQANVINNQTGLKIDLSVWPPGGFHDCVLSRRRRLPFGPGGPAFYVVSPEDVILMKLIWRRESRSEKQWRDALGVVRVRGSTLDWAYLREHAEALVVLDQLIALRDEGGV